LPLLGNAIDLVRDPLAFFVRTYEELGPVFRAGGPGRTYTVLAGPEANRSFLEWEEQYMTSGPVYQPYIDDLESKHILIAMDGEPHRAYRKWLRPGFSREAIGPHVPRMIGAVEATINTWKPGEMLKVTEVLQFLVAQLSGMGLAGCPVDGHFDDAKVFGNTFLGAGVGSFPGFMRMFPRYRRARRRFLDFLGEVVSDHREGKRGEHPPDLIDLLLGSGSPDGEPLTESDILASAHMPYTNSLVYVAATCGFMLYELLNHRDVLEQVQLEVDSLFAGGPPKLSSLRRAKWLRGALLETQRLHPIALSVPRYVHRSFEFEGYHIEAGSLTLTATAVTHFLPAYFPDPYRFDVSRYWAPRYEHRQPGALVPYGLGPHVCLSAGVVNAFIMLTVGALLRHVDLAMEPPEYELGISVAPFPAPAGDFKVRVLNRRSGEGVETGSAQAFAFDLEEILPEVDSDSLSQATEQAEKRRFAPGALIIQQGDLADALYIVTSGRVEVIREGLKDESKIVARLGVGEFFGEIGLLQAVPRTASVRAETAVKTIVLGRETFTALVADTDMTSGEIAAVMHRRLTSTTLATALPKLTLEQVAEVSPRSEMMSFAPAATIIRQGDPADHFYIIVRGQVEVVNLHPDGREIHLGALGEGDYFGEIGLLRSRPRNATIRAIGDSDVVVMALGKDAFMDMMADSDATSAQVALRMAERLTDLINATARPD
jgi:cytochrome P450/CRP-like cAMP-binding protein